MKQKKIIANIGRFTEEKGETFYVDRHGKVWSQQMMNDLVNSHRAIKEVLDVIAHYKKFLE